MQTIIYEQPSARKLQSSKVPSSRIGRLFHYGGTHTILIQTRVSQTSDSCYDLFTGLAASLGYGAASELLRRSTADSDEKATGSLMLTEGNVKRLVSKLTQMRGAALKMGQFMSIQGLNLAPGEEYRELTVHICKIATSCLQK